MSGVACGSPVAVTPEFEAGADRIIARYPASRRSASLMLLHYWQETHGHISGSAVEWIAAKLGLQPINIEELVSFYPMFRRETFGKTHIRVCRTLSCMLGGAPGTHAAFLEKTGATGDPHGPCHSPDGKYTVEYVECLASCGTAPVVMVNDDFYEKVDAAAVEALLRKYS
ncbi:MAG: NAD(P)H-dependent oxidoreductase subunit E [Bdellovibrionaceae bacterium]|nr:NAD(P)H-dependent oxidoreductase subunit E [Pseudobdellovibrionaceae bacterium]